MIATAVSTVFGIGYARFAPGTVASFVALPFAWLILWKLGPVPLAIIAVGIYFLGVWTTHVYAARIGEVDPSECVIDEVAGQWLTCAAAPLSLAGFALAFVLFRFFDISKLWPVSAGEKPPGGWGIMTDDMIAAVLSAAIVAGLRWRGLV